MKSLILRLAMFCLSVWVAPAFAQDTTLIEGTTSYGVYDPIKYGVYQKANDKIWAKLSAHKNGVDNSGSTKRLVDYSFRTNDVALYDDPTITINGFHTFGPGVNAAVRTRNTISNPFYRGNEVPEKPVNNGCDKSASKSNGKVQ